MRSRYDFSEDILLLIHDDRLFFKLKEEILSRQWNVHDFIYQRGKSTVAVVDRFYYEAHTPEYLRETGYHDKQILFVVSQRDLFQMVTEGRTVDGKADDILVYSDSVTEEPLKIISARWGQTSFIECLGLYLQHKEMTIKKQAA